jgi:CelD/BcsL family acetyltransferase involved in cellulose biosynthesis
MTIEVIAGARELFSLRDEWNALLQRTPSDGVFLTHEWLHTWWKHLAEGRRLSVLAVRSNGVLEAIVPLALRPPQYSRMMPQLFEFIGTGVIGSDYLDIIVPDEKRESVLPEIGRYLRQQGIMLHLGQARADGNAAGLAQQLAAEHWGVVKRSINVCPFIRLEGHSWETYLAALGSSHRYNLQRRSRKLANSQGFEVLCASTPQEADRFLEILIDLHRKRWSSRREASDAFQNEEIIDFHREFVQLALNRGWLRLWTIWLDGRPLAALYALSYRGRHSFYQSGFDPECHQWSPGLVIMGLSIRKAVEEGASEYDFLHGNEEYKFHWAREARDLVQFECYPPAPATLIYRPAISINRAARRMARRVLTRT